jgi:CubicO group peptidase (beta-lactamase class C family)
MGATCGSYGGGVAGGPTQEVGAAFCYSNLGYVVAGALLEMVTGTAWEELMRRELFYPLALRPRISARPAKHRETPLRGFWDATSSRNPGDTWAGVGTLTELNPDDVATGFCTLCRLSCLTRMRVRTPFLIRIWE